MTVKVCMGVRSRVRVSAELFKGFLRNCKVASKTLLFVFWLKTFNMDYARTFVIIRRIDYPLISLLHGVKGRNMKFFRGAASSHQDREHSNVSRAMCVLLTSANMCVHLSSFLTK